MYSNTHRMSNSVCVASLEFNEQKGLNNEIFIWIKLQVVCESDGKTLWHETFNSVDDVKESLQNNEIDVYDVIEIEQGIYAARAKSSSMLLLAPWSPSVSEDSLYVRTFYTIINKNQIKSTCQDIFDRDSCWSSIKLDSKTISEWFMKIKDISVKN